MFTRSGHPLLLEFKVTPITTRTLDKLTIFQLLFGHSNSIMTNIYTIYHINFNEGFKVIRTILFLSLLSYVSKIERTTRHNEICNTRTRSNISECITYPRFIVYLLRVAHKTFVAKSRNSLTSWTLHSEDVYNYSRI